MIIVYTGNGKGKTTAALGQAVRVLGRGKRAIMVQFIKGPWRSGEDEFISKVESIKLKVENTSNGEEILKEFPELFNFKIRKMGLGFVGILGDQLPIEEHKKAARKALDFFKAECGKYDLVILDEINVALSLGLIEEDEILEAIKNLPEGIIVILTGRGATQKIIDKADLATEMREIKHPYKSGVSAKINIEF